MKHVLRLCAITILLSAVALQGSQSRSIKASMEGRGSDEAYVTFKQDGKESTKLVLVNFFGDPTSFNYSPTGGDVTLNVYFSQGTGAHRSLGSLGYTKKHPVSEIIGKQIIIERNPQSYDRFKEELQEKGQPRENKSNYSYFIVKLENADAPSKSKIRAYKTTQDKIDWTVVISDQNDTPITKTTFKKNTGNLYLQLNSYEITKTDDPNIVYNANKISVFRGKDITVPPLFPAKTVKWNEFDSAKPELEISATGANFVEKGSEKKSKIPDKKIRAYKTVEDKFDWTVQITDNSDNEISHSTFKKNTDGLKTRSLYLRLNPTEITDGSESQKRYNVNKVKVFKGKKIIGTPFIDKHITVANFNAISDGELQISDDDATLVAKGLEKK